MTTHESFLKDIEKHDLLVVRDDGVNRHIIFKRPTSNTFRFELITWPGYLCFTGDMGTYMFTRLDDMFEFFRTEAGRSPDKRYWAEKCISVDKHDGLMEFDPARFKREITVQRRELFLEYAGEWDFGAREDFWNSLQDVHDAADDSEGSAYTAVREFSWSPPFVSTDRKIYLSTDGFPNCKAYSERFTWCCYALAWGIAKYDTYKETQ